ncbi:hypothetical protein [Nostoc sp.]|uniref:hypothetical protein n=1 Tax=Nostoc sp. TaxID=1180 RepID=UPI002FFA7CE3
MHTETSLSGGFCFWRSPPQQKVEPVRSCRTISDRKLPEQALLFKTGIRTFR